MIDTLGWALHRGSLCAMVSKIISFLSFCIHKNVGMIEYSPFWEEKPIQLPLSLHPVPLSSTERFKRAQISQPADYETGMQGKLKVMLVFVSRCVDSICYVTGSSNGIYVFFFQLVCFKRDLPNVCDQGRLLFGGMKPWPQNSPTTKFVHLHGFGSHSLGNT